MGRTAKLLALFVGLAAFGLGLWLVGVLCFLYLLVSSRPGRGRSSPPETHNRPTIRTRFWVALVLLLFSATALASEGTLSPIILLGLASVAFLWPVLPFRSAFSRVFPVEDSILLRSAYIPFVWHGLAEVKPGAEDLPRALASYAGTLVLLKKSGATYVHVAAVALDARSAEARIISQLREAAGSISPKGAYLLPLDSKVSYNIFRLNLTRISPRKGELAVQGADVAVLDSADGFVRRLGAYITSWGLEPWAAFPSANRRPPRDPLLWEVLQSIGKERRWPDPDRYSDLLASIHATKGEPIAQRFNGIEGSGPTFTVQGLGGDALELSRPQLRAIVAVYP